MRIRADKQTLLRQVMENKFFMIQIEIDRKLNKIRATCRDAAQKLGFHLTFSKICFILLNILVSFFRTTVFFDFVVHSEARFPTPLPSD